MEVFLIVAEWLGTVAFAMSGALRAIQKKLDLFGVLLLSGITALGGGTFRDILLGQLPPKMFYSSSYLIISVITGLIVFLAVRLFRKIPSFGTAWDEAFNLCDAIGLGIFAVVGTQNAIDMGYEEQAFLCIFMGVTTGVGGGIVRDIMCAEIPGVLRKHIYAVAAILGSGSFYLLYRCRMDHAVAACIGIALTVIIRVLASHFRWNLPKASVE